MILLFRPFKVGDYVEAGGMAGTVKDVGLFTCELATPNNVKFCVPNGQIWGQAGTNYSANATRRIDFVIGIGYDDDMDRAIETIRGVFAGESRGLADPAPAVVVDQMAESAINVLAQIWVNNADYGPTRWDLTKTLKERPTAAGITIPYPQRTVYMVPPPQPEAAE